MAYLEVAKLHPKLGELLEKDAEINVKAAEEFAAKHGVSVDDINNLRGDASLFLGMNQYQFSAIAFEVNKRIPNDVIFKRINAGGVESEWIYVSNAAEKGKESTDRNSISFDTYLEFLIDYLVV